MQEAPTPGINEVPAAEPTPTVEASQPAATPEQATSPVAAQIAQEAMNAFRAEGNKTGEQKTEAVVNFFAERFATQEAQIQYLQVQMDAMRETYEDALMQMLLSMQGKNGESAPASGPVERTAKPASQAEQAAPIQPDKPVEPTLPVEPAAPAEPPKPIEQTNPPDIDQNPTYAVPRPARPFNGGDTRPGARLPDIDLAAEPPRDDQDTPINPFIDWHGFDDDDNSESDQVRPWYEAGGFDSDEDENTGAPDSNLATPNPDKPDSDEEDDEFIEAFAPKATDISPEDAVARMNAQRAEATPPTAKPAESTPNLELDKKETLVHPLSKRPESDSDTPLKPSSAQSERMKKVRIGVGSLFRGVRTVMSGGTDISKRNN